MKSKESILHEQVCDYIRWNYPNVIFRTDFAAGTKMTMGQAIRHKRLQWGPGFPDLFIAEPRNGKSGLFIELKATNIYKRDGSLLKNEHLQDQMVMLTILNGKGYVAVFSIGFESTKDIIDRYLK